LDWTLFTMLLCAFSVDMISLPEANLVLPPR
jgi:hypothetical protein